MLQSSYSIYRGRKRWWRKGKRKMITRNFKRKLSLKNKKQPVNSLLINTAVSDKHQSITHFPPMHVCLGSLDRDICFATSISIFINANQIFKCQLNLLVSSYKSESACHEIQVNFFFLIGHTLCILRSDLL